jgi:hypothetical protein
MGAGFALCVAIGRGLSFIDVNESNKLRFRVDRPSRGVMKEKQSKVKLFRTFRQIAAQ